MYYRIINNFLYDINVLKTYVDSVEPIFSEMEEDFKVNCQESEVLRAFFYYKILEKEDDKEKLKCVPEQAIKIFKELEDICKIENIEDGGMRFEFKDNKFIKKADEQREQKKKFKLQKDVLYKSSLVSLIIYFESLVSQLFKEDFERHPDKIGLNDKTVKFSQIDELKEIESVKDYLIENEIVNMMYKDIGKWFDYFRKNIDLKPIDGKMDDLIEITKRRNLLVHNNGVVNTFYIDSIPDKFKSNLKKGSVLVVDRQYIDNAIRIIEYVGIILTLSIWLNEERSNFDEMDLIESFIFDEYLIKENWEIAIVLYKLLLTNKKLDDERKIIAKLNLWQCSKWLGKYKEIENAVKKEDYSAWAPKLKLGILALMEEVNKFFELYDNQNEIDEAMLQRWPIFREIRETKEYKERFKKDPSLH